MLSAPNPALPITSDFSSATAHGRSRPALAKSDPRRSPRAPSSAPPPPSSACSIRRRRPLPARPPSGWHHRQNQSARSNPPSPHRPAPPARVRGGGELGPPWHTAGQFANKQNTVTDLLSCADRLATLGYTDPAHLAALGTNAGGIAAGAAITWQPAAFRAAVIRDGLLNPLRSEDTGSPEAIVEFGSAHDPAQFPNLLPIDAYSQIKDGKEYPSVLLSAHFDDPAVPAWESAKMAARLDAATTSLHPILLRVSADGPPHTREARAQAQADDLAFLLWQLGVPSFQSPSGRSTEQPAHKGRPWRHSDLPG
ncbi:MAG: prolyl oligopeptidase family serine peptidase [Rhodospirillales bacterium]